MPMVTSVYPLISRKNFLQIRKRNYYGNIFAKNNIIILKVFFEIGISGRKADKRPEFQKMIGLAKSSDHPVDVILVWKFSRFARNQEESIVYKSLFAEAKQR